MRRSRIHLGDDVRELEHRIGDVVDHRCRRDGSPGLVVGYKVCPDDLLYLVSFGDGQEVPCYGLELSADPPGIVGDR